MKTLGRDLVLMFVAMVWSNVAFGDEIHEAAERGDWKKVKALIQAQPELVSSQCEKPEYQKGCTPLHFATEKDRKDVVEFLLGRGADAKARNSEGLTPLHGAAAAGSTNVAELLLAQGVRVNVKDNGGSTPLHYAAHFGKKDMVEWLLAKGADVNARDSINEGWTPLHHAAYCGQKGAADSLLAKGADINSRDALGKTPLHHAASGGRSKDTIDQLRVQLCPGESPRCHEDVMRLLLANGADIAAKDKHGSTPLHDAAHGGLKDAVKLLLVQGAEVNARTSDGVTPLESAVYLYVTFYAQYHGADAGHKDVVRLLLAKGAEVNTKGVDGKTPLFYAVAGGYKDIARWLLACKAEYTIYEVAGAGDLERVRALLKAHPELISDKGGGCPALNIAARNNCRSVVEFLLAKGADVNARRSDGETPLCSADQCGRAAVMKFLRAKGGVWKDQHDPASVDLNNAVLRPRRRSTMERRPGCGDRRLHPRARCGSEACPRLLPAWSHPRLER